MHADLYRLLNQIVLYLPSAARHSSLLKTTDRCVMCGMCLPHCPTYHLTRDEAESPRGRIALIQGVLSGRLEQTARLETHLDHCLGCRACEAVCPSGVPYGEIIDGARAALSEQAPPAPRWRRLAWGWVTGVISDRRRLYRAARALRFYQRSGLRRLARLTGLTRRGSLGRLDALLPPLPTPRAWPAQLPAQTEPRGEVGLFLGCVSDVADRATLDAAARLLTRLGYRVHLPEGQTCCGALHLHQGDPATAQALAQRNRAAFKAHALETIISVASGCGATLAEYPGQNGAALGAPVRDISAFLHGVSWPEDIRFAPLRKKVAVQDPCSLTHVLRQNQAPYSLLARIPEIELIALPDNRRCCGAAGSYMLTQPAMAEKLRDEKIAALKASGAEILLTSNIGCALHLRAGLRAAGMEIEVMHPIALLARQLRTAGTV